MVYHLPSKQRVVSSSLATRKLKEEFFLLFFVGKSEDCIVKIKINMSEKLRFKEYRRIAPFLSDISFFTSYGKFTKKQRSLLAKYSKKSNLSRKGRSSKLSSFGQKLQSKRLFSILYGNIRHKQYSLLYKEALKYPGKIGINFLSLVEKRLDVVVYRMFFFKTLKSVRQCINHKGILINNKIVNLSSYQVKMGDIIQIKDRSNFLSQSTHHMNEFRNLYFQVDEKIDLEIKGNFARLEGKIDSGAAIDPSSSLIRMSERGQKNYLFTKFPHYEVNYKILTGIFLFSPQQLYYPLDLKMNDLTIGLTD